jgi:hypothetical protein
MDRDPLSPLERECGQSIALLLLAMFAALFLAVIL